MLPLRKFKPHQLPAFDYLMRTRHPFLAQEMRLGKNIEIIRRVKLTQPINTNLGLKILVVGPNSVLASWERELELENEPKPIFLQGTSQVRREFLNLTRYHWRLHNGTKTELRWFLINKEGWQSLPEIKDIIWDWVILDESWIRNPRTKVTKFFLQNFRNVQHRALLTGTPNPESILELWTQVAWLDGSAFGHKTFWGHRAADYEPNPFHAGDWTPKTEAKARILEEFGKRAFIQRRKDPGVDLEPHKVHEERTLELTPEALKLYNKAEKDFDLSGRETIWATDVYIYLRRLCGGVIDGKLLYPNKMNELIALLNGELYKVPVVVWFFFNDELYTACSMLIRAGITCYVVTGETKPEDRRQIERDFREREWPWVVLMQEAVGPFGMDLSRADTVIYYSGHPAALITQQSEDRIVNLAKNTTLLYIHLNVKDTVDSDIYAARYVKGWTSILDLNQALSDGIRSRQLQSTLVRRLEK